jgi:hypothetical protein
VTVAPATKTLGASCNGVHTGLGSLSAGNNNRFIINRLRRSNRLSNGSGIALSEGHSPLSANPFMTPEKPFAALLAAPVLTLALLVSPQVFAQGPLPDAPASRVEPAEPVMIAPQAAGRAEHRFWDAENCLLLGANAALSGADFAVTRSNLRAGGTEMNPIVRGLGTSTPALAANFAGETAGVLALSYLFHRTGHHRLERAAAMINLGASAGAVAYGSTHRGVGGNTRF